MCALPFSSDRWTNTDIRLFYIKMLIIHSHSKFVDEADKFVVRCDIFAYKLHLHQALFAGLLGSNDDDGLYFDRLAAFPDSFYQKRVKRVKCG